MTTIDHHTSDTALLTQFIACFDRWDDLYGFDIPTSLQVAVDERGWQTWRPRKMTTDRSALKALYRVLPGRFPPLYEQLILSYRWTEVNLDAYSLMGNAPASDLSPLLSAIRNDELMSSILMSHGFLQFGKAPDVTYDPVCSDLRHPTQNGDYRIVQLDHEAILCYDRIGKVTELAPDFRSLISNTVQRAASSLP